MGNHRRGKGHHSQNNNSNRKNSSSSFQKGSNLTKDQQLQLKVDLQVSAYHQLSKEVEEHAKKNLFFASWKEVIIAMMSLLALGFASVIIGVAAGMTISLHYFEDPMYREGVIFSDAGSAFKVTSYDSDILARNSMDVASNLHPGRVIKSSRNQERLLLSVVPVEQDGTENMLETSGSDFRDIFFTQPSIKPVLCSDGKTMGYNDWHMLKAAIRELNALSAEKFLRWHDYFGSIEPPDFGAFEDDAFYYEDETILTICPSTTLKARREPIFINAENLLLECDDCTLDTGGSHFSFGPHARNILIRGITFQGARSSSLYFHYNGADVTFEDCLWINSFGSTKYGPVADFNSTSLVTFHRCNIADTRSLSNGRHPSFGMKNAFSYAMSIRSSNS